MLWSLLTYIVVVAFVVFIVVFVVIVVLIVVFVVIVVFIAVLCIDNSWWVSWFVFDHNGLVSNSQKTQF